MINYDLICGLGWLIPDWGSPESEFGGGGSEFEGDAMVI